MRETLEQSGPFWQYRSDAALAAVEGNDSCFLGFVVGKETLKPRALFGDAGLMPPWPQWRAMRARARAEAVGC